MSGHFLFDQQRILSLIKTAGTLSGDLFQGPRQIRLFDDLAGLVGLSGIGELRE